MNVAVLKATTASQSVDLRRGVLVLRQETLYSSMQLFGTGRIAAVALTDVCEALHLFPRMPRFGALRSDVCD